MQTTIKNIYNNREVFFKLIQCAWDTPKKSLGVYNFYCSIEPHILFFERERAKLAKILGELQLDEKYKIKDENIEKYQKKIDELLDTVVNIKQLPITLDDVSNTQYTDDKEGWFTPVEMYKLDVFLKKQEKAEQSQ